jgi:predicted CxxxxCH...CXXCH cytochrome family protein
MPVAMRRLSSARAAALVLSALLLALFASGCDYPLADGLPDDISCSTCHGSAANSAPPAPLSGDESTAAIAVGAHQSHLIDGLLRKAIPCNECHVVPANVGDEGHVDPLPAELTFGALATTGGIAPAWDRGNGRCQSVYCHGETLGGGSNTQPIWNVVDGTEAACGTCHSLPPPAPHPDMADCHDCHAGTVNEDLTIDIDGELHINGVVDVEGLACNTCHGNEDNAAPPVDVSGQSDTALQTVGAHQPHLVDSDWHRDVQCSDCHVVPATVGDDGHIDDPPAELTWGAIATADGATPSADATCSGVYCHGSTLTPGGSLTEPVWTTVDGTQAVCGTCHGIPPDPPHTANLDCGACHGEVYDGGEWIDPDLHINGIVEVGSQSCNACHGSEDNAAPPVDTNGNSDTTLTTVGAHQPHLGPSTWHREVECSDCHVVPAAVDDPGHIDDPPAELTWGAVPLADGATPTADASCTGVYCHGTTLEPGGTLTAPVWTTVDGTQAVCGTCHSLPPGGTHTTLDACELCHGAVIDASDNFVDPSLHINGVVDVGSMACNGCHGSDDNSAPPVDVNGDSDTTLVTVGAHQSHLGVSDWHHEVVCSDCHQVPTAVDDPGHIDDFPAELTWSALASADSATPLFDHDSTTCTGVYCHGTTFTDPGPITEPDWTLVDGSQALCGTCHTFPPGPPHVDSFDCGLCHGEVYDGGWVDPTLHIDGTVQVASMACNSCHGNVDNAAPPLDILGQSDTTLVTVGAHQSHMVDGDIRLAIPCSECHVVPVAVDEPTHIDTSPAEITWGALATTGSLTPDWNISSANLCSNTYCHGTTLAGGSNTTPDWTNTGGGETACGTCHGAPPPLPHAQQLTCNPCHPNTVTVAEEIDVPGGFHLNGTIEAAGNCNTCHGNVNNNAPPLDTNGLSDTTLVTVGAHQSHMTDGLIRAAIPCSECHLVPSSVSDPGHIEVPPAEITWGPLATTGSLTPDWSVSFADLCSNTYCHGTTLGGGTNKTPDWTNTGGGEAACGTCHGTPPPSPHPQQSSCNPCHSQTVTAAEEIDIAGGFHIDGQLQVSITGCNTCHGIPPATGSHLVHYGAAPTDATYGGTGTAEDIFPGDIDYAFDCGNCHPLDLANHGNGVPNAGGGTAEIDLSPTGAPIDSVKALNPTTASYTPGGSTFSDADGFSYTLGSCDEVYCHSSLTVDVPGPVMEPADVVDEPQEFQFTGYPIDYYPAYAVTYGRSYASLTWGGGALTCDSCHAFPPRTDVAAVAAGAGDSHSWIGDFGYESLHGWNMGYDPLACSTCHQSTVTDPGVRSRDVDDHSVYQPVPIVGYEEHVNGQPDVAFTSVPVLYPTSLGDVFHDLSTASWDSAGGMCNNVSCHLNDTTAEWGRPYRWWIAPECNACHQY